MRVFGNLLLAWCLVHFSLRARPLLSIRMSHRPTQIKGTSFHCVPSLGFEVDILQRKQTTSSDHPLRPHLLNLQTGDAQALHPVCVQTLPHTKPIIFGSRFLGSLQPEHQCSVKTCLDAGQAWRRIQSGKLGVSL